MPKFLMRLLLVSFLIVSFSAAASAEAVPQLELDALMALYDATDGDNWKNNGLWGEGTDPENWWGVETSGGHVSTIYLYQNRLVGTIPADLANLANLTYLDLKINQLTGTIPAEIGNIANLEVLNLMLNQLEGGIPSEIGNLTHLTACCLHSNQLTGAIPATLGNLTNLEELILGNNQLTGSIPPELGNLTGLQLLDLSENLLSGTIPDELTNLTNLEDLYLDIEEFDYHAVGYNLYQFMTARGVVFPDDYVVPPPPTAGMDAVRMLLLE
jgi:hypothetical protein